MGLPQAAAVHESRNEDPIISVEEAWLDDEDSAPWCVDSGEAIQVMSSRAVYDAVEQGVLSPTMLVWRDGRACWLPIAECYELTVKPEPRRQERDTPVSGVRRVRRRSTGANRRSSGHEKNAGSARSRETGTENWENGPNQRVQWPSAPESEEREPRHTLMLTTSFAIGVIIGALLYLPFAW
jgi:hypothetical protein